MGNVDNFLSLTLCVDFISLEHYLVELIKLRVLKTVFLAR